MWIQFTATIVCPTLKTMIGQKAKHNLRPSISKVYSNPWPKFIVLISRDSVTKQRSQTPIYHYQKTVGERVDCWPGEKNTFCLRHDICGWHISNLQNVKRSESTLIPVMACCTKPLPEPMLLLSFGLIAMCLIPYCNYSLYCWDRILAKVREKIATIA